MSRILCWQSGIVLALALVWSCSGRPPEDTTEKRAALATRLAGLAAEHGAFDRVLDTGADLATGATVPALELDRGRSLSDHEQALLRGTLRSVIAEFVSREQWQATVARIYAREFSAEELEKILEFYDTPLGHEMIRRRASLTRQVETETEKLFNQRLDAFIRRADEAVAAALPAEVGP